MPVFNNILAGASGATRAAAFQIDRSLRFNRADDSFLNKTPSSAGTRTTWTWSGWVKKASNGVYQGLFTSARSGFETLLMFDSSDRLHFYNWVSNAYAARKITTAVFRDPSAWYHIVFAWDSTNSTAANRAKLYVNGTQITDFGTSTNPGSSEQTTLNDAYAHRIGDYADNPNYNLSGYLADVYFIDGQALAPTDFGEYDDNNNWQPKEYSGTYGTNGFYLKFADNSSNAALGTDSSGNSNTWTVNNINADEGGTALSSANGAVPILNTSGDQGGTVTSGVRSDSNSANIVLALPLNGSNGGTTITDYHHTIKGSGSAKAVSIYTGSASGGAVTSTAVSRYYGSSFYAVRGATNNYTASDYIYRTGDTDLNLGTGDFCVEFWYYPQSMVTNSVMFDNRHESNSWPNSANGFALIHNAGGSIFSYSGGNQIIAHGNKLTADQWNHVAYTRDNGTERLFVNGDFFSTTASSSRNYNEGRFHLGSAANNGEGTSGYYQGLRIYKGTPKYTSNFTIPEAGDPTEIDSLIDTPSNYAAASGNNGGNYCTLNPLDRQSTNGTLSNGNLDLTQSSAAWAMYRGTMAVSSGKWYYEVNIGANQYSAFGILSTDYSMASNSNAWPGDTGAGTTYAFYPYDGTKRDGASGTSYASANTSPAGSVYGVAFDLDNGTITFYKDGTSLGQAFSGISGTFAPVAWLYNQTASDSYNFGQRPFAYTPPTGFKSLCTTNLADPTIADGSTAMDVKTWSGDSTERAITGYNFSPDFVWVKTRSASDEHVLADVVRGGGKVLSSSASNKESDFSDPGHWGNVKTFDSDGFTVDNGAGGYHRVNLSGRTYVGWAWDGGTSTVSNTDGSITSNVRANQSAGFSIVSWSGTSANATVGHGLNAAPEFIITKVRGMTSNWYCYHTGLTDATKYIWLNSTAAQGTQAAAWNSTDPTSSVIHVGGEAEVNRNGYNTIAYCFSPVSQYSAFGSYTGNGSADGPFVYTGFRVRFLLVKNADNTDGWSMWDAARDPDNEVVNKIEPNTNGAEGTNSVHKYDFLSNGFKVRGNWNGFNGSGNTIIYAAFAEHPFKTARAR